MTSPFMIVKRCISTSSVCQGVRNFRNFDLYNKRGSRAFKQRHLHKEDPDMPIQKRGCRDVGIKENDKFVIVQEMIPQLIVPDLTGFTLKPYLCYQKEYFVQREFTAQDLFDAVYAPKIKEDFKNNKLTPEGDPLEPSEFEKLTPEEAIRNARKTGSDMFTQDPPSRTKVPENLESEQLYNIKDAGEAGDSQKKLEMDDVPKITDSQKTSHTNNVAQ